MSYVMEVKIGSIVAFVFECNEAESVCVGLQGLIQLFAL